MKEGLITSKLPSLAELQNFSKSLRQSKMDIMQEKLAMPLPSTPMEREA